ncbi:MAG TPA: ABC transporter substrate-binding protein [Pseudogracilibacillus sp.]|nr:ABC transporter substrate-binding protein [Pseudogracilibacillus sp.]
MKKNYLFLVGLVAILLIMSACGTNDGDTSDDSTSEGKSKELVVTSFGGQYDEVFTKYVIEPFEAENEGVTVKLAPYTGVAKLNQGGANVDVIQLDDFDLIDAANKGLLEPLDESNFDHWDNLYEEAILNTDDGQPYGLVNVFGAWGIAYNPEEVSEPTSWNDLKNDEVNGKLSLMGQWIPDILLIAEATGATYDDMGNVWDFYETITPSVVKYYSSFSDPESLFGTGEVAMASWFDGRAVTLKESGENIDFVIPEEGGVLIRSGMAVSADSENKELAQELIDFAMSVDAQKGFSEEMYYGPTNSTVELDDSLADLVVYGEEEVSNLIAPDWNEILPKREEWLLEWTEATSK